jgi:hypothetical protein
MRNIFVALTATAVALTGCVWDESTNPGNAVGLSTAYARWTPTANDTCTEEEHNRWAVVGPDGQLYPTWHPAVDPESGCTYGHDHGRDPRGSALYATVGPIPFGYANEMLDIYDPSISRHEDHVGHKVEWENDIEFHFGDDLASSLFKVSCDVLTKLHQGTHSKDAFTNNMHELAYHIKCSDGTQLHMTVMARIGDAGEFVASCDHQRHIEAGVPSPPGSPDGGGRRSIPDRQCIEELVLVGPDGDSDFNRALRESWEISESIRTSSGRRLASINPYFQAFHPSRYYDATAPDGVARPIDLCYEVTAAGEAARGGICEETTAGGALALTFDDPRSAFNGAHRFVDINGNTITNAEGPEVWYSDPFGHNASTDPFPGSIRQFIARIDNDRGVNTQGPVIGRDRDYGEGTSVHPPN